MTVTLTIDGARAVAREGADLLSTCLENGIDLPFFCWHGALGSVGACRLCAVAHRGPEDDAAEVVMACMTEATEGAEIRTDDPQARALRAAVTEWTMIDHPHDCAVCTEGGNCHLQDMTVMTGHRTRRYRGPKRTFRDQDLGPLLTHQMNRCIACYRCTRFYRDLAGGRDIGAFGSAGGVWFGRAQDGPPDHPLAGNLAEVCPVGVFGDARHAARYARPWELRRTPSVCAGCALGCNTFAEEAGGTLRRIQNRYNGAVNGFFLCDRGRFAPAPEGPAAPPALGPGDAEDRLDRALRARPIAIGSPRAPMETLYALRAACGAEASFAGTARAGWDAARAHAAALARTGGLAGLSEIAAADAVLVLGCDISGLAPRAGLALREAARGGLTAAAADKGVPGFMATAAAVAGEGRHHPVTLVGPGPEPLAAIAARAPRLGAAATLDFARAVRDALGGSTTGDGAAAAAAELTGAERPVVVVGALAGQAPLIAAACEIAKAAGARLAVMPDEANSLGAALLGAAGAVEDACAAAEADPGRPLIVAENDLFERVPAALVERLRAATGPLIVLDHVATALTAGADAVLPVAGPFHAAGTRVNFEGRAQRHAAALPGGPPAAWRRLLPAAGSLDALLDAMARDVPGCEMRPAAPLRRDARPVPRGETILPARTADDRAGQRADAVPPGDADLPLGWSMEGARPGAPALRTSDRRPGWTSSNAAHRLQEEIGGPLHGGDPGHLLRPDPAAFPMPDAAPPDDGAPQPLHDPFTGDETLRDAPPLSDRRPPARIATHPSGGGTDPAARPGAVPERVTDAGIAPGVTLASAGAVLPRGGTGGAP